MTTIDVRPAHRLLAVAAITAMCLALLPGTALAAGNVRKDGSKLIYTGGGEVNSLTVAYQSGTYTFVDSAAGTVSAGNGCDQSGGDYWGGGSDTVDCDGSGVTAVVIRTRGGDDSPRVAYGTTLPSGVKVHVDLGDGRDSWSGSRATPDMVYGGAGADEIDGAGGNDVLRGGGGNDDISGSGGNDSIYGGAGADTLSGGPGDDAVNGDGGNDKIYGFAGRDTVHGGDGDDLVSGGLGADTIIGGDHKDRLLDDHRGTAKSFLSPDVLRGGRGIDTADYSYRLGEATNLWLSLDRRANDGARGEGDQIGPDGSVERVIGGLMNDVIVGSDGPNTLWGHDGHDEIRGRGGYDRLHGDGGRDRLEGGGGDDELAGWWGSDTLVGGPGTDFLQGGVDNDLLLADDGTRDTASCGGGTDRAVVDGRDVVTRLCEQVSWR